MPANYITSILKENRIFYPPKKFSENAHIKNMQQYGELYKKSVENPEAFWAEMALQLEWYKKWDTVLRNDMGFFKWFEGGYLNVCYNCLDRIVKRGKKRACCRNLPSHDSGIADRNVGLRKNRRNTFCCFRRLQLRRVKGQDTGLKSRIIGNI